MRNYTVSANKILKRMIINGYGVCAMRDIDTPTMIDQPVAEGIVTRINQSVVLARKLSLSIVAEGVETKEQLDYLNQNNIFFLQGRLFL